MCEKLGAALIVIGERMQLSARATTAEGKVRDDHYTFNMLSWRAPGRGEHQFQHFNARKVFVNSGQIYITWNQCDAVEGMEGEEASLYLKSEIDSDCAVFAS